MQASVGLALSGRGLASPSRCTSLESAVGHPWLFPSFQVPLLLLLRMCDEEDKALTLTSELALYSSANSSENTSIIVDMTVDTVGS